MKKLLSVVLCFVLMMSCAVTVLAHEGHDHENESTTGSSASISPDLDLDQDGIPDYEDVIIDIDGDGIGDAGPTYQKAPSKSMFADQLDVPWVPVICAALFIGLVAATFILKAASKKKKEDNHV